MKVSAPPLRPVTVLPEQRPDHREVAGPGAYECVAHGEPGAPGVRSRAALKKDGKSANEAGKILVDGFRAQYRG